MSTLKHKLENERGQIEEKNDRVSFELDGKKKEIERLQSELKQCKREAEIQVKHRDVRFQQLFV